MKELITYIADDGTLFNDYVECVKYENNKIREAAKGQLRFYDYDFQIIADETLSKEKAPQILLNCYYLFIGNEAAIKLINEISYLVANHYPPKEIGYWYYDPQKKLWFSLTKKIEEFKNELNILEYIHKNLEVN